MCFNQTGDISTLDGTSLKLVDKFTYLGSTNKYYNMVAVMKDECGILHECKKNNRRGVLKSGNILFFLPAFAKQEAPYALKKRHIGILSNNRKLSRTSFHVLVLFKIIIAIMSNHTCEPFMCWEMQNLVESSNSVSYSSL